MTPLAMIGPSIYSGALLMEFTQHYPVAGPKSSFRYLRRGLASLLGIAALVICGFPEYNWEWSVWSQALADVGNRIFPRGLQQHRMWPSIGMTLLALSISYLPAVQRALSHRYLVWLGSVSFPMYLLHGPLIRSLLCWMLYGWPTTKVKGELLTAVRQVEEVQGSMSWPASWMYYWAFPTFFVVLLTACHYWRLYVERWCSRITANVERFMCVENAEAIRSQQLELIESGSTKFEGPP